MASTARSSNTFVEKKRPFLTRRDLLGYAFISPWIIGFLAFTLFPFVASLFLSFTNWSIVGKWTFVGLANYAKLASGVDDRFMISLTNTVYYAVINVPGSQIIALALALLLNKKSPGIGLFRTVFYIPAITFGVGTSFLWAQMFSSHGGPINGFLALLGIEGPNWLFDLDWSLRAIIIIGLWNVGTSMLIYLAALQGVPQSLYDASAVDGASWFRRFTSVTLPMVTPAMFFNVVLGFIGTFQVFTVAKVITNGGPANSTLFYALYLYQVAFLNLHMGYAAALAWILFLIILAVTVINLLAARLWVYYEGATPGAPTGPR
jgi:multiple sugar transport system permease protein